MKTYSAVVVPNPGCISVQTYLGDITGSVPDHQNKVNIAIKQVTGIFGFPSAKKVMFTLSLLSVH